MATSTLLRAALVAVLALTGISCRDGDGIARESAPDGETGVLAFTAIGDVAARAASLQGGAIDAAWFASTEAVVAEHGWVVLADDRGLQAAGNLLAVVRSEVLDGAMQEVLEAVSALLTTEELAALNRRVDRDLEEPEVVAHEYLRQRGVLDGTPATGGDAITIGASTVTERVIVAHLFGVALRHAGFPATVRTGLGSDAVAFAALEAGELDIAPEQLDSLLERLGDEVPTAERDRSLDGLRARLAGRGLAALDPAPAERVPVLVVTPATAARYRLTSVSDLRAVADILIVGGPADCRERPWCLAGLRDVYGLRFVGR